MRGRMWGLVLLGSALATGSAAPRAVAAPDATEPSVCAPPCPDGQICVGQACVTPGRRAAPPPARAPQPAPPPPAGGAPPTSEPRAYPPPPQAGSGPPQPSTGATYPPPGRYPPPPGYYYPPPPAVYAPPPPPHLKRRFFAMPFAGVHSYQHSEASQYDPGARVGALLGGRIGDVASLNGEIAVNVSNVHGVPSGVSYEETNVVVGFSPFFQLPAGTVEIGLGPKLGIFVLDRHVTEYGSTASQSVNGFMTGLNAGLFFPVSPRTSIGALLSYELMWASNACTTISGSGQSCASVDSSNTVEVLGVTAAAIF